MSKINNNTESLQALLEVLQTKSLISEELFTELNTVKTLVDTLQTDLTNHINDIEVISNEEIDTLCIFNDVIEDESVNWRLSL